MDRKRIGRYEIVGELGRGAMGAVYRAHDPVMGRTVALKCILSAALSGDQTSEYRQRFFREARAAGALAHPGIVPVFDAGEDDGVPFLVMELVQGQTLADSLKQGTRYSIDQVCEIGQHMADALGFAHRNGVIHRDIKPANILMTSREIYGAERPRITDFGVAKFAAGGEVTTTGQLLGTPAFMPPEQFTGAPIDGRTDLFSLGVILYRMACGEQPFAGETLTAVSYKIVHTDPIPPSRLNPAVSQAVELVLLRALAKNPAERFQTGEEMAAALAAVRFTGQTMTPAPAYPAQATMTGFRSDATIDVAPAPPRGVFTSQPPQQQAYSSQPAAHSSLTSPAQRPYPQPSAQPPATKTYPPASPAGQQVPPRTAAAASPAHSSVAPRATTQVTPVAAIPIRPAAAVTANGSPAQAGPAQPAPAAPVVTAAAGPVAPMRAAIASAPARTAELPARKPAVKASTKAEEPAKKRGSSLIVWVLIAVAAVFVIRYLLQDHVQQSLERAATGKQPSATSPAAGPTLGASTAKTEFNPHGLDPSRSGRLRLDLDGLPSALPVSLEVDGRPYWSGTADTQNSYSGFLIPAGRHQLRLVSSGGTALIASNSVSADFTAGKRALLSAQARPLPAPGAAALDPGAKITLAVRPDAMMF
jgi:serine/threonine-protein kinase